MKQQLKFLLPFLSSIIILVLVSGQTSHTQSDALKDSINISKSKEQTIRIDSLNAITERLRKKLEEIQRTYHPK